MELSRLVARVAAFHQFTEADRAEALHHTLADPEAALECIRLLAAEIPTDPMPDDRMRCTDCANLTDRGRCLAAWRGEIVASRSYEPVKDIPRRCEGFKPEASDGDQRTGAQRWPGLLTKGGNDEH